MFEKTPHSNQGVSVETYPNPAHHTPKTLQIPILSKNHRVVRDSLVKDIFEKISKDEIDKINEVLCKYEMQEKLAISILNRSSFNNFENSIFSKGNNLRFIETTEFSKNNDGSTMNVVSMRDESEFGSAQIIQTSWSFFVITQPARR